MSWTLTIAFVNLFVSMVVSGYHLFVMSSSSFRCDLKPKTYRRAGGGGAPIRTNGVPDGRGGGEGLRGGGGGGGRERVGKGEETPTPAQGEKKQGKRGETPSARDEDTRKSKDWREEKEKDPKTLHKTERAGRRGNNRRNSRPKRGVAGARSVVGGTYIRGVRVGGGGELGRFYAQEIPVGRLVCEACDGEA